MTFDMCEELSKSSATLPLKSKHQTWFKIGPSTPFEIALQLWTASSVAQSTEGLVWPLTGAHLQWSSTLCEENGFTSHHVGDESWVSGSQTWRVLFRSSELSAVLTPCEWEEPKAAAVLITDRFYALWIVPVYCWWRTVQRTDEATVFFGHNNSLHCNCKWSEHTWACSLLKRLEMVYCFPRRGEGDQI